MLLLFCWKKGHLRNLFKLDTVRKFNLLSNHKHFVPLNLSFLSRPFWISFFQKRKCFIPIKISRKLTKYHGWDSILMFYTFFRPPTIQNTKLCPTIQNSNLELEIHSLEIMRFLWWKRLKLWKRKRKITIWTVICPRHRLKFPGNNLELIIKGTMTTIIGKVEKI